MHFSCDTTGGGTHVCSEYDDVETSAQLAALQSACTAETGTAGTACATANVLGVCAGVTVKQFYYTGGALTAAQAQMACTTEGGTWTAG
jgi:hypothetical protein